MWKQTKEKKDNKGLCKIKAKLKTVFSDVAMFFINAIYLPEEVSMLLQEIVGNVSLKILVIIRNENSAFLHGL